MRNPNDEVYIAKSELGTVFTGIEIPEEYRQVIVNVRIEDGVTELGDAAFAMCAKMQTITIPNSVTIIGRGTFAACSQLSSVVIPGSVKTIGAHAFKDCTHLTQIRIPADCALGTDVFDGCTKVYVFGTAGSAAEAYCSDPEHGNCVFIPEEQNAAGE